MNTSRLVYISCVGQVWNELYEHFEYLCGREVHMAFALGLDGAGPC